MKLKDIKFKRRLCFALMLALVAILCIVFAACSAKSNDSTGGGLPDDEERSSDVDSSDDEEQSSGGASGGQGEQSGSLGSVNVTLSASYVSFSEIGATYTLEVIDRDYSVYGGSVTWSSSDDSVASVDQGIVTARGEGESVISAATEDGEVAYCPVEVYMRVSGIDADVTADGLVSDNVLSVGEDGKSDISSSMNLYTGEDGTKISVNASSDSKMSVVSLNGEYSYAVNLGGKGSQSARNFEIVTVGAATITVYVKSSGGDDRTLAFYGLQAETDGDGKVSYVFTQMDSEIAPASGIVAVTFDAAEAGTYYILSAGSGIYVYEIEISYSSVCDHTYEYWTVTTVPTAAKAGKAERSCVFCGASQTLTLPKLTNSAYTVTSVGETSIYSYVYDHVTISFEAVALTGTEEIVDGETVYKVTFVTNQATIPTIYIDVFIYECVAAPILPGVTGQYFMGWYTDSALTTEYDFSTPVTSDLTLYAKFCALDSEVTYVAGVYESIAAEWTDTDGKSAKIYYKIQGSSDSYTLLTDSEAVRQTSSATARVDILGLVGGEYYSVKIITSGNEQLLDGAAAYTVYVSSYDRSGYAHYEYDDAAGTYGMYDAGVGAYENDGTLKDGALVIYVTEENKNDVTDCVYKYDKAADKYVKVATDELSPYLTMTVSENITLYSHSGSDNPNMVTGIGEILNNRRYSGSDRRDVGIAALSKAYGSVVIRIVGEVTASITSDNLTYDIIGLTDYDAATNGGSVGDNGSMARMVNAQNVTIEGIGEDAAVTGWGFHFISSATYASSSESGQTGVGFEVRNLTFSKYCEDAVGMEGEQDSKSTSSDLSASVERCWVHNNTFLAGECSFAAESDKKEGDGSCDFKRGQYFTLSYNYFYDCHKTNLIGSASTSLQYNITMHHNYWYNCESRIPLVRNANVHFYNNYICGDGEKSLSYVHSARADSYIFAENNYYENCKNPQQTSSEGGGAIKAYGNEYLSCYGDMDGTEVEARTESVKNSCRFSARGIDYSSFDTDPSLFYYDEDNERSDCYLTDAVTARQQVMRSAGAYSRDMVLVDTDMATYGDKVASDSVNNHIPDDGELDVSFSGISAGTLKDGIYYSAGASSGNIKGKGQIITFRLTVSTEVHIADAGTSEKDWGELVSSDGRVYASHFSEATVILPAGTYFLQASTPQKELTVTKLTFTSGQSDEAKVQNVIDLINSVGPSQSVTLTPSSRDAIDEARAAYDALSADLKALVTNYDALVAAEERYSVLEIENVKTLIDAIGTVGENSGSAIQNARAAYDALTSDQKTEVSNYDALVSAEEAYSSIAVAAVGDAVENLASVDETTLSAMTDDELRSLLSEYEIVVSLYEALDAGQRAEVANYSKVTDGIAAINDEMTFREFVALLDSVTDAAGGMKSDITGGDAAAIVAAYNALSESQICRLSDAQKSVYEEILAFMSEFMQGMTVIIFADPDKNADLSDEQKSLLAANNADVTVVGNYKSNGEFVYDGVDYVRPLKWEDSTLITISVPAGVDLDITICFSSSGMSAKYSIGSISDATTDKSGDDGVVTLHIDASDNDGTLTLKKNEGTNELYYIIVDATGASATMLASTTRDAALPADSKSADTKSVDESSADTKSVLL